MEGHDIGQAQAPDPAFQAGALGTATDDLYADVVTNAVPDPAEGVDQDVHLLPLGESADVDQAVLRGSAQIPVVGDMDGVRRDEDLVRAHAALKHVRGRAVVVEKNAVGARGKPIPRRSCQATAPVSVAPEDPATIRGPVTQWRQDAVGPAQVEHRDGDVVRLARVHRPVSYQQRATATHGVDDLAKRVGRRRSRLARMNDREIVVPGEAVVDGLAERRQHIL